MAITRTQIAKQLLAQGGRIGLQGGGADMGRDKGPETGRAGRDDREIGARADRTRAAAAANQRALAALGDPDPEVDVITANRRDSATNFLNNLLNRSIRRKGIGVAIPQLGLFDAINIARMTGQVRDELGIKSPTFNNDDDEGEGEGQSIILPQTMMAQAPSITEQEPEEPQGLEGLRLAFRAEGGPIGGEYDFESARQMYGLGKLVKKVTKTVKKIAKSPVGKAAITAASLYYMPKFGIKEQGGLPAFLQSAKTGIGNFFLGPQFVDTGGEVFRSGGLFSKFPGGGVGALIAGTSIAAGLLTPKQEEEAQALAAEEGIDIEAARNSILARARDDYKMDFRARGFRAEGGRIGYQEGSKEPVAKKTMPLLDLDGKEMDLREEGGFVPIGRMEKADDVPARLSKNEFVFTAEAVRNAGEGDVDKGAEVMYNMMKNLEAGGEVSEESQGLEGARKMFQTSQRLEEVL